MRLRIKPFQHSIGLPEISLIPWQSILSRMAGNQVVPRLACLAFQEWTPREPTPFFSPIDPLSIASDRHLCIRINEVGLQDMISLCRLFT